MTGEANPLKGTTLFYYLEFNPEFALQITPSHRNAGDLGTVGEGAALRVWLSNYLS